MRRLISLLLVIAVVSSSSPACSEEEYDPQNTMLALNMAIVSIHKIIATQDRIVLDQEYNTIINKLALGNIESDYEMTGLFSELMNFITGKGLRQEEAKRFQERYNRREQRQLVNALSGIRAYGGNLWSWLGSLATSCVSSYFSYQTSKSELIEGLDDDLWQLKKEDIADCNELQVKLLNSSWNLLRQYKLPDEYRLTQEGLNGYYKAVNEAEPSKRLRMLRARNVERDFQVYPPYWYYRAKAAQESGDDSEALRCWDKFAEIWRPVLRNDPYKLEEAKYRIQRLAGNAEVNREEIRRLLEVIQDNTTAGDWSNNLFAGVVYFLLGDKDEGIACVETNVDFAYEEAVSRAVLSEMKKGELNALTLYALKDDIRATVEKLQAKQTEPSAKSAASFTGEVKDKQLAEALINLFEGREKEAETALVSMSKTSENPVVFDVLVSMNVLKNNFQNGMLNEKLASLMKKNSAAYVDVKPLVEFYAEKGVPFAQNFLVGMYYNGNGVTQDKSEAVKWCRKAAEQGLAGAQRNLGITYDNGEGVTQDKSEAVKWYRKAAEQGDALAQFLLGIAYNNGEGVTQDKSEAVKWIRKATEQGYANAQFFLGIMYDSGEGVTQDSKEAVKWFRRAAEQGYVLAQYVLGLKYGIGQGGVERDCNESYMWLYLAYLNGYTDASKNLKDLEKEGWFSSAAVSKSEAEAAKAEAQRKYDEIRKRNGWN